MEGCGQSLNWHHAQHIYCLCQSAVLFYLQIASVILFWYSLHFSPSIIFLCNIIGHTTVSSSQTTDRDVLLSLWDPTILLSKQQFTCTSAILVCFFKWPSCSNEETKKQTGWPFCRRPPFNSASWPHVSYHSHTDLLLTTPCSNEALHELREQLPFFWLDMSLPSWCR